MVSKINKAENDNKKSNKRLTAAEKAYVMMLLASGLSTHETAKEAAKEGIKISQASVARYYLPKLQPKIAEIVEKKDESALKRGIALKEVRVQKLADMEALMYDSIYQLMKSGYSVEALIREWRGLLDDVAKEMGERRNVNNNTINVNNTINIVERANALLEKTYGETIDGSCTDAE